MDNLKKWLAENPEAGFQESKGLEDLWPNIEEALDKNEKNSKRVIPIWTVTRWAAAVVLIAVASFTLLVFNTEDANQEGLALHDVSSEMAETEYFYSSQVSQKMELIRTSGVEIDPLVFEDIQVLDSAYKDLMHDLKDGADNQEVVEAMIENYRLKLSMLEKILKEIGKKKSI